MIISTVTLIIAEFDSVLTNLIDDDKIEIFESSLVKIVSNLDDECR